MNRKFLPYSKQSVTEEDILAVSEALKGDYLTCGNKVDEFEQSLCEYIGVKYAVVMNSATSALHVAYLCLGIKKGDEVITTPITFCATSNAALMCGADIKFCDVKDDGNIDETKIESIITNKTKVITPVDFSGNSVNIKEIMKIAKKHNIKVIDDASHALGSMIDGKKVGMHADISIFSFHAIKPITTFEGGALVTDDENIANLAKMYRSHGITKRDLWDSDMGILGYNYRLSDVACSLGISQLKRLDEMISKRDVIAKFYDNIFKDCELIKIIKIQENKRSSRHLYFVLLCEKLIPHKKEIFKILHSDGIGVQVHYKPVYKFSFYQQKYKDIILKGAESFYDSQLSLPCNQSMSMSDAQFIAKRFIEVLYYFDKKVSL